ncbi:MAG: amidohydrolase [Deltaproteobacteria bacterium]|nr:amidohydrolase [Deltaproteobacteria bacterium]
MILAGARFWGADGVEAVLVREGRIVAAGGFRDLRTQAPSERVRDVGGGFAVFGLSDAHGHLALLGETVEQLDLRACRSAQEVAALVREAPRRKGWVRGRSWSDAGWPEPASAKHLAEAARGDKIYLERADFHAVWVSPALLEAAGIRRETPDPSGGRIERDANGEPTGVLVDKAMELVERLLPTPTDAELDARMLLAAQRCAKAGFTCVHDCGLDAAMWKSLLRLESRGELPIRVYGMERQLDPQADAVLEGGPIATNRLTLRCVKFFCDGALGSRGAAFFEPYADGQGGTGLLFESRRELAHQLAKRMRQGFQVALHAIGDRANALALDAIADALAHTHVRDARPRIEHAQHVRPRDVTRFAQLGVIASMQPSHHASDWPWAKARLGRERYAGAYAWKMMLEAGVPLAFGSDFPIETEDVRHGLQSAIYRDMSNGDPDERLTGDEALRAFTLGAAWASFQEGQVGLVAAGRRADVSVFRGDLRTDPRAAQAVITFLDGEPV